MDSTDVMAEKLRWHRIAAGGQTGASQNLGTRLTNTTDSDMFIRRTALRIVTRVAATGEGAVAELTQSPAVEIDGDTFFREEAASYASGVNSADAAAQPMISRNAYARGEVVLEPGDSLYLGLTLQGTPTVDLTGMIGYHF